MNKRILMVLLGALPIIALGGCMKVSVDQVVQPDGSSHVRIVNDISAIAGLGDLNDMSLGGLEDSANVEAADLGEFEENLNSACDDFYRDTTLQNPNCARADYVITMEGDLQIPEEQFKVKKSLPYKTYSYNAQYVFDVLGETGGEQSQQFNKEKLTEAKAGADLIGMTLSYTVTMPGKEVIAASIGDIDQTTVTMDIFDLIGEDEVMVESQELNWLWIILGIGLLIGGLMIAIVVLVVVMKSKRKKKSNTTPQAVPDATPFRKVDESVPPLSTVTEQPKESPTIIAPKEQPKSD